MDLSHSTPDFNQWVEKEYHKYGYAIQGFRDHTNIYCDKDDITMDLIAGIAVLKGEVGKRFGLKTSWIGEPMMINIFIDCGDEGRGCCHFGVIRSYRYILSGQTEIIRGK